MEEKQNNKCKFCGDDFYPLVRKLTYFRQFKHSSASHGYVYGDIRELVADYIACECCIGSELVVKLKT